MLGMDHHSYTADCPFLKMINMKAGFSHKNIATITYNNLAF